MSRRKNANVAIFVPHAGCPHQCVFCDQRSISGHSSVPTGEEVAAVLEEAAAGLGDHVRTAQVAFFGGSFTAIPRDEMIGLLAAAQPFVGPEGFAGIRISTRPDAIDEEVLALLADFGVTAIELGAQSMDDAVLAASGRGHTAADVMSAARLIRQAGFSLGLQMMTGLPGDSDQGAVATATALADLAPDTIRIYPALVLAGTPLATALERGTYAPQTQEEAVALCARLLELFHSRGIAVIRLGLHDSPDLRQNVLAGPHHPAFRELCEAQVLLEKALPQLPEGGGSIRLRVAAGSVSKMAGQHRSNLLELSRRGYRAGIREDETVPYLAVQVEPIEK